MLGRFVKTYYINELLPNLRHLYSDPWQTSSRESGPMPLSFRVSGCTQRRMYHFKRPTATSSMVGFATPEMNTKQGQTYFVTGSMTYLP